MDEETKISTHITYTHANNGFKYAFGDPNEDAIFYCAWGNPIDNADECHGELGISKKENTNLKKDRLPFQVFYIGIRNFSNNNSHKYILANFSKDEILLFINKILDEKISFVEAETIIRRMQVEDYRRMELPVNLTLKDSNVLNITFRADKTFIMRKVKYINSVTIDIINGLNEHLEVVGPDKGNFYFFGTPKQEKYDHPEIQDIAYMDMIELRDFVLSLSQSTNTLEEFIDKLESRRSNLWDWDFGWIPYISMILLDEDKAAEEIERQKNLKDRINYEQ